MYEFINSYHKPICRHWLNFTVTITLIFYLVAITFIFYLNNNFKFEKSAELAKKLAAASGHNTGAPGQSWAGRGGAAPSIMEEFPSLPGAPKVKI